MTTTPSTTDATPDTTTPAAVAPPGTWKRGGAAIAMLALGTLTLFLVEHPSPAPQSPTLDRALVAIQTKPGAARVVMSRLRAAAASVRVSSTPDRVADLPLEALTRTAADHDVVRLSGDSPVVGRESRKSTTPTATRHASTRSGWGPVKVLNTAATTLSADNFERVNSSRLP